MSFSAQRTKRKLEEVFSMSPEGAQASAGHTGGRNQLSILSFFASLSSLGLAGLGSLLPAPLGWTLISPLCSLGTLGGSRRPCQDLLTPMPLALHICPLPSSPLASESHHSHPWLLQEDGSATSPRSLTRLHQLSASSSLPPSSEHLPVPHYLVLSPIFVNPSK